MTSEIILFAAMKHFTWEPLWTAAGALTFGCILILEGKLKRRQGARLWGYFMVVCGILYAGISSVEWYLAR
jgi:hypothetical protein